MDKSKTILKFIFVLCIWSFLVLGILKLNYQNVILSEHFQTPMSRRFLLQKENRYFDGTSTTPDGTVLDDVLVDNRQGIDDDTLVREVELRMPSLPIAYWNKYKASAERNYSSTCAKYPSIFELEFNNVYWQTLRTSNGTFQLLGAYYDIRNSSLLGPAVRILGMIDRIEPSVKTYCQLWFDGQKEPTIVQMFEYKYIWHNKWGNYAQDIYQPYLMACPIEKAYHGMVPASVSIVEQKCDTAKNNLRVIYNRPSDDHKKGFAVCVKGLDFLYEDLSVRLVEWIELLHLLGADKIYFYKFNVHPNISKVLEHYETNGMIEVTPLTLPGGQPNDPGLQHWFLKQKTTNKRQNEIIPYNDCLYRNLYLYDFIALLDIDEVIMPKNDLSWKDLMKRTLDEIRDTKRSSYPSYNVRNVYFLDEHQHEYGFYKDIPKYLHMLQHVHRAKNYTKPNHCLREGCTSYPISTENAQLQHYRSECVKSVLDSCEDYKQNSMEDKMIWKYKEQLIHKSVKTLEKLGFLRSSNRYPSGERSRSRSRSREAIPFNPYETTTDNQNQPD